MKIKIKRLNCSGTKLENYLLFIKTRELVFTLHVWKKKIHTMTTPWEGEGGEGEEEIQKLFSKAAAYK